jgi:transcriptional regulator with XRE-family HTH domain
VAEQTQGILGEFIRAQRQFADLSLRQLADLSKVSNAYLSQVERGLYTPSAHVLKSIAEALDLSAETLYARAGLLDDAPEGGERPVSVEEAIRLDERFTAEQKDSLLRLCAIFRGAG